MSRDLVVRDGSTAEADVVGAVLRRAFPPEWLASSIYCHPWGDRRLAEILAATPAERSSRIRVAVSMDVVVGCAIVDPAAGHLDYIAVLPEHAGKGAGGALLSDAEVAAAEGLSLDVFADNSAARTWYASRGYLETGDRRSVALLDVSGLSDGPSAAVDSTSALEVSRHGFAAERTENQGGAVDVVLYGDDRLRVRGWEGLDLHSALALVSRTWPTRPTVCLMGADTGPVAALVRWQGALVRMARSADAG